MSHFLGVMQMEVPAFASLEEEDSGIRKPHAESTEESQVLLDTHFLVYQKILWGLSMTKVNTDLALIDQTDKTSTVPLRALDPKEKSKGLPFSFGLVPLQTKASHRSEKRGI